MKQRVAACWRSSRTEVIRDKAAPSDPGVVRFLFRRAAESKLVDRYRM